VNIRKYVYKQQNLENRGFGGNVLKITRPNILKELPNILQTGYMHWKNTEHNSTHKQWQ